MIKRWFRRKRFKDIGVTLVSILTVFWLVVEVTSFFTNSKSDPIFKNIPFYIISLCIILFISFYINRPRLSYTAKIKNRDSFIEVRIGDAFKNQGSLVIPINNYLDVSLGGNVAKAKSLQNKLITDYYDGKAEHLKLDIEKTHTCRKECEIGTVVEIESQGKTFYLLVNTRKQENNRVKSEAGDLEKSLISLWDYIANDSHRNNVVTIPVIGGQHSRRPDQKIDILRKIIHSYILISQDINVCGKLVISVPEAFVQQGLIDIEEVFEYMDYSSKYFIKNDFLGNDRETPDNSIGLN